MHRHLGEAARHDETMESTRRSAVRSAGFFRIRKSAEMNIQRSGARCRRSIHSTSGELRPFESPATSRIWHASCPQFEMKPRSVAASTGAVQLSKKPSSGEARLQHMFEVEGPPHGCLRNVVARRGLCDPKRIGIRRRIARGGAMRGGVSDPSLRGHSRTDHHARSLRASRSLRRAAQRHRGGRRRLSVESRRLLRQPADPVALFARAVETVRKRPAIRFKATA